MNYCFASWKQLLQKDSDLPGIGKFSWVAVWARNKIEGRKRQKICTDFVNFHDFISCLEFKSEDLLPSSTLVKALSSRIFGKFKQLKRGSCRWLSQLEVAQLARLAVLVFFLGLVGKCIYQPEHSKAKPWPCWTTDHSKHVSFELSLRNQNESNMAYIEDSNNMHGSCSQINQFMSNTKHKTTRIQFSHGKSL